MSNDHAAATGTALEPGDFAEAAEPFALFDSWLADATRHEPNDPNAMALATVDAAGHPNVRMVLLKAVDPGGPPRARLCFLHQLRERQGPRARRRAVRRARFLLEKPASAGARARAGDADERCGGRRLLRYAPALGADRCLGVATVASAGKPLCTGKGRSDADRQIPRRGRAASAVLVGLSRHARSRSNSGTAACRDCTSASPSSARRPAATGSKRAFIPSP